MKPQLSQQAKDALKAVRDLHPTEQLQVAGLIAVDVAARINDAARTAIPKKRAKASSHIEEAVKTATHGFKQVTAPDDIAAIEVKITRPTGKEVTILLSEGARGRLFRELADYGKNELKGATLLTREDFEAVVYSLFEAIKCLKVVKGALQTKDVALQQAYRIVTDGVRRADGFSWGEFDFDGGGAVVGRRVYDDDDAWCAGNDRDDCAAFASPPAESQ
jgi:hypothetical protein